MGSVGRQNNCFVCNAAAIGPYFPLETYCTQSSKVRIIEKLAQLVGDKYMFIISNDDIICRGCASMFDTLDQLEKQVNSLRSVLLRHLEEKYQLEQGELSKEVTPQISNNTRLTYCTVTSYDLHGSKKSVGTNDMAWKKRKATSMDDDVEEWTGSEKDKEEGTANAWLQCAKCKHTTTYSSFKHNSNKKAGDKPVIISEAGKENKMMEIIEKQKVGNVVEDVVTAEAETHEDDALSVSETLEMIAAEINNFANAGHSTPLHISAPPAQPVSLQVLRSWLTEGD